MVQNRNGKNGKWAFWCIPYHSGSLEMVPKGHKILIKHKMSQSIHPGVPMVAKNLSFQAPNMIGLAKVVKGIIINFLITEILHLMMP